MSIVYIVVIILMYLSINLCLLISTFIICNHLVIYLSMLIFSLISILSSIHLCLSVYLSKNRVWWNDEEVWTEITRCIFITCFIHATSSSNHKQQLYSWLLLFFIIDILPSGRSVPIIFIGHHQNNNVQDKNIMINNMQEINHKSINENIPLTTAHKTGVTRSSSTTTTGSSGENKKSYKKKKGKGK